LVSIGYVFRGGIMASAEAVLGGADAVLAVIERAIAERGIGPGGRLPTERDLAVSSGQSRAAVRRALGILEADGRIVRHVGRGTFLAPVVGSPGGSASLAGGAPGTGSAEGTDGSAATSPAEIMAVRLLIEPRMMPLAVAAATSADFAEIERCLAKGDEAASYEDFEVWDAALHRAFAGATHNSLLASVMRMINEARDQPLWGTLKRRSSTPERRDAYRHDHRAIAGALAERHAEAATEAMRQHLLRVRANILGDHG
jgi:DNA-binding FadR family transcriptional regulator